MLMRIRTTVPSTLLTIVAMTVVAGTAEAKSTRSNVRFTDVGEPIEGGSWHQAFHAETFFRTDFDQITGVMDAAGPGFEAPGFSFEPETGWSTESYSTPDITVANGPTTNAIDWIANFEGDADTSPAFGIDLFLTSAVDRGSVLVGSGRAFWTGGIEGEWLFSGDTRASWRFVSEWMADVVAVAQVPLPAAQLLGLVGMGLAGFVRRRMNNA